MKEGKAEYFVAEDAETKEEIYVKVIPPQPEGDDLGGITEEEKKKIYKNETLDVEVNQTGSQIAATYTYDEIMTEYSKGRDVKVRLNSESFSGQEFVMQNSSHSVSTVDFFGIFKLSGKLIFLQLECSNQDEWKLISKQYLETDSYYLTVADGAGSHNAIYRGENLGKAITEEQLSRIADGTFKNMFVGDYWEVSGNKYVIADFDYMYNVGDTALQKHHIVIVPEKSLYTYNMNDEDVVTGGYVGSKMYKEGLEQGLDMFKSFFGESHVLTYRNLLVNAAESGYSDGIAFYDRQIDLMNENMVLGGKRTTYTFFDSVFQKGQLSLFRNRHDEISISRESYWIRDISRQNQFGAVNNHGYVWFSESTAKCGVRPYVLIG
jgi:hypothetical protein